MVGGCDTDHVDVIAGKHIAEITVCFTVARLALIGMGFVKLFYALHTVQTAGGIDIAYSGDVHALPKESACKSAALNADTDNGNAQLIVRAFAFFVHVIILFS
jgi:hypothetical protein